ncbi:MAG: type II toxin-antitoxin system prevent-host-death family antitoxin [Thermoanaerobaculaceae bacterium]|jgi:prevent-host-death family protein|nr:type II toxin-antitoxin system prevent-host-death family antitoxin [Thermoanaerobaculaceae bacterium]
MTTVNTHEAKTQLSRLLQLVEEGEEVVIARSGRPVARLVPYAEEDRVPGRLKGHLDMDESFDLPLPDGMAAAFRGDRP